MNTETNPDNATAGETGKGVATIGGAGLFFSLNSPLARYSYGSGANPGTVVFLRAIAAVLGIGALALSSKRSLALPRAAILPLIAMSASISVQGASYLSSIAYIPVGLAALLFYTFPLMVALAGRVLDGIAIGRPRALAFGAAFVGIGLAIGPSFNQLDPRGIGLALLAAFANMLAFRTGARALRYTGSVSVSFYGNLGCVPLLGLAMVMLGGFQLPEGGPGWAALIGVGVFYTLAMLLHFAGMRLIGATHSALIYNLEPLFSIAAAAILLGERLTLLQYLGGAFVVGALVVSDLVSAKTRSAK